MDRYKDPNRLMSSKMPDILSENFGRSNTEPNSQNNIDLHYSGSETSSASESASESGSSNQSIEVEWANSIEEDGSLIYVESYVSSTVKEKQAHQAMKAASESERKSPFPSPPKSIKRNTKLLNLLKRRPSVRVKSPPNNASEYYKNTSGSGNSETNIVSPKVTFRDNPSGEVRKVVLRVTEVGSNYGRRASVSETVLGVMPGRFSEPPDSRVMVAGLAPGSQALKDGTIKIGDWLKEVNGKEITWENLDSILLKVQVPSTVTLLVQKCASETLPHDDLNHPKRITQTRFVKLISGKETKTQEWNLKVEKNDLPLHAVLYLSLNGVTEESPDKADIRYQFPSPVNKLVQVRGMFITTAHSLQEVTGSPVLSSTVQLHGVYYHVAFCREENDVFLIALPHSCISKSDIIVLMEQLSTLVKFEFGSLARGFSNFKYKPHLDHLFYLLFEDFLTLEACVENDKFAPEGSMRPHPFPASCLSVTSNTRLMDYGWFKSGLIFSAPCWLILRDESAKLQIETCLNELESGDFGEDESDCEDCQLLYNILGCCIFYKGFLVTSHLDLESSQNVWLFAHYHRLLSLTGKEALSQLVLWKRVFITPEGVVHPANEKITHYLLTVAMNHILLAMLVESGNVTELLDEKAGPDPFLVDQAETTLYHLHSLHVHTACEESLCSSGIDTVTLDAKFNATSQKKVKQNVNENLDASLLRIPDVPSILKQKSTHYFDSSTHAYEATPCECERSIGEGSDESPAYSPNSKDSSFNLPEGDDEEEEEEEKEESDPDSDWRMWKGAESKGGYAYSSEAGLSTPKGDPPSPLRVTVGRENVLFHLIHLDVGEGILITPCKTTFNYPQSTSTPLHSQLLQSFHSTCSHIRHVLHSGIRTKNASGHYIGSCVMNSVKEYGIMFECSLPSQGANANRKKSQNVSYWVIGRLYGPPYEREIYVAVEDSIPQNIQEIAFKVSLGCS